MIKFSVLVDDEVHRPACVPERGLALLLECDGLRVLFDSGRGQALGPNAEAMGVDLGSLSHVVLSHGHYDHVGGVGALPVFPSPIPLIACPDVFHERGYFLPWPFRRHNLYRLSGRLEPTRLQSRGLVLGRAGLAVRAAGVSGLHPEAGSGQALPARLHSARRASGEGSHQR